MQEAGGKGRSVGEIGRGVVGQTRRIADELRDIVQGTFERHHQPAAQTQKAGPAQKVKVRRPAWSQATRAKIVSRRTTWPNKQFALRQFIAG